MSKRIAVIPGDGVGPEVVAQGLKAIKAVCRELEFETFPWGSAYYHKTGQMMPDNGLEVLRGFDAIYLGAIGWPTVPDHISLWGLLLPIRKRFEQYVNLRPVRLLPGSTSPLLGRGPADIDMLFVRENTEGEYSGAGGRVHIGTPNEVAVEVPVFSRVAIERVIRYAFERARERRHHLVSVTKSNASRFAYVLWDEVAAELSTEYSDVRMERGARRRHGGPHGPPSAKHRRGRGLKSLCRHPHRPRSSAAGGSGPGGECESQSGASIPVDVRAGSWVGAGYRGHEPR